MADLDYRGQIMHDLDKIPTAHLGPLAELIHYYCKGLQTEEVSLPSSGRFSQHNGVISKEDAEQMLVAIEEGCERVDAEARQD